MKGRRRSQEEREDLLRAYAERTGTSEEFCKVHRVSLTSLMKWSREGIPSGGFRELTVRHDEEQSYRIRVGDYELLLPPRYSISSVKELLKALGDL